MLVIALYIYASTACFFRAKINKELWTSTLNALAPALQDDEDGTKQTKNDFQQRSTSLRL